MTVVVVDYGMGNLRSVAQAVQAVAGTVPVVVSALAQDVRRADRVVLPGQGAIRDCMRELAQGGSASHTGSLQNDAHATQGELLQALLEAARSKPMLGVCVGMQMLLTHSDEGGVGAENGVDGLNLIPGVVRRFPAPDSQAAAPLKVPHIGWNRVRQTTPHPLWQGIANEAWFYFVHSYYAQPAHPAHMSGETVYGLRFASAIARDNLFATQFHPEKSAQDGLRLYANFLHWNP